MNRPHRWPSRSSLTASITKSVFVPELVVQRLHRGHLIAARPAPRRPDVQEYHFAAQRGKRNRIRRPGLQREIRGEIARRHRRTLVGSAQPAGVFNTAPNVATGPTKYATTDAAVARPQCPASTLSLSPSSIYALATSGASIAGSRAPGRTERGRPDHHHHDRDQLRFAQSEHHPRIDPHELDHETGLLRRESGTGRKMRPST